MNRIKEFALSQDFLAPIFIFSKTERKKLAILALAQVSLGILDLLGVALIGLVGALAVTGVQSSSPGNRVSGVLNLLGIQNLSFQQQIAVLGLGATAFLIARTVLSVFFTRKSLFFLSRKSANLSLELTQKLMNFDLVQIQRFSSQHLLYSVTAGVSNLSINIIGSLMTVLADSSLLIILTVGLLIVDAKVAIGTILLFGFTGLALYKLMHKKAFALGAEEASLNVQSNENVMEILWSFRETYIKNRTGYYAKEIGEVRLKLADVLAELSFMPNISKYVIESSVILGALCISATQFLMNDAAHAIAILSVFMAAGTRIGPALLRIQQAFVQMKGNLGASRRTLELLNYVNEKPISTPRIAKFNTEHPGFTPLVRLSDVNFEYEGSDTPSLVDVTLDISQGQFVAIVGPSGAGKTTLADVLLGVIKPNSGKLEISGMEPRLCIENWPGAFGYVPQSTHLSNASIRENLIIGYNQSEVPESEIWKVLEIADLADFVRDLPEGLDTELQENGTRLSGGQRQRLGIARALLTNPGLIVLDEATSSLDSDTERRVSEAIQALRGTKTIVVIAHRLSTVQNADKVIYMASGRIISQGTFEEVRKSVKHFNDQAQLMGL